ncbi:MAG TPA: metalloregulator ArsR/SmtB family transcription factor [Candidatus Limnocylindria bacterium]|jgi:ArsR family transcriptional regulator|nr:metalloregulator ArsR/SmtB family transcription factor [Candidatus Limnocylindria bacterium]
MQDGVPERPLDPVAVKTAEKSLLSPRNEHRMKELLDALCDPTRVKIVRALRDTTLAAGDLAHVINRSRSATSQHLKVLRDMGVVIPARSGNVVRYTLSEEVNGQVIEDAVSAFDQMQTIKGGDGDELSAGD